MAASGGPARPNSHTMAIHRRDARWRPHKVAPGPTTGPIRQAAESRRHFDAVEQEFGRGFEQFKWAQPIGRRGCWSWGRGRNCLFRRFLTVSPASTGSNSENVDPGGVCWTAELWLARFLCNFIDYIPAISEHLYTLFSYIYTTVNSAISPHFLLYIMTVNFTDRMKTAILCKNYHTLFNSLSKAYFKVLIIQLLPVIKAVNSQFHLLTWFQNSSRRAI